MVAFGKAIDFDLGADDQDSVASHAVSWSLSALALLLLATIIRHKGGLALD